MLRRIWEEFDSWYDICRVTRGFHIEHFVGKFEVFLIELCKRFHVTLALRILKIFY